MYVLKFQQLLFRIRWHNNILVANYYFELKNNVKNKFCSERFNKLWTLIEESIQIERYDKNRKVKKEIVPGKILIY